MRLFCFYLRLVLFLLELLWFAMPDSSLLERGSGVDNLLILSTLDGALHVMEAYTGKVVFTAKDFPVLGLSHQMSRPLFLPDPTDGAIYTVTSHSPSEDGGLHRLPRSIPEMVTSAPFSHDGMLYTGEKQDSWYRLEKGGVRLQDDTCPPLSQPPLAYIGRAKYSLSLWDSLTQTQRWNVTYYNFSAELLSDDHGYILSHYTSDQSGLFSTVDTDSGKILWHKDFSTSVVAAFVVRHRQLVRLPLKTLSGDTFSQLLVRESLDWLDETKLSLFVGRFKGSLYARPAFVHPESSNIPLISGPEDTSDFMPLVESCVGYFSMPWLPENPYLIDDNSTPDSSYNSVNPNLFHWTIVIGLMSTTLCGCACIYLVWSLRKQNVFISSFSSMSSNNSYTTALSSFDADNQMVSIGKLTLDSSNVLGRGCYGTTVYKGYFEKRKVAVKRLVAECLDIASREVSLLSEADHHPHVVRYYCMESDRSFLYLALELAAATLKDCVEGKMGLHNMDVKTVLIQATRGLDHLHRLNVVHRDIKPQNILISQPDAHGNRRAMLSDFGLCKKIQADKVSFTQSGAAGTDGWIAPEVLDSSGRASSAVDVFALGCVYYYMLSNGAHPFGDRFERQNNILSGKSCLEALFSGDSEPTSSDNLIAYDLILSMISNSSDKRPLVTQVLYHPFFWSLEKQMHFFEDVSDRIEKEDLSSDLILLLESNAPLVTRKNWRGNITPALQLDLKKYRSYNGASIRDLLRAMRNKRHHYRELPDSVKETLGSVPDGFVNYFTTRFPHLLIHTYRTFAVCDNEVVLRKYYHE